MFLLVFNSSVQEMFWNFKDFFKCIYITANKPKFISEAAL